MKRAPELNSTFHRSFLEIQFGHCRTIPQTGPRPGTGPIGDDGVWIRGRNVSTGAHIEGLQDSAGVNVEQNDIVRKIIRYQQAVAVARTQDSKPGRIGGRSSRWILTGIESDDFPPRHLLRRDRDETLRRNFSI